MDKRRTNGDARRFGPGRVNPPEVLNEIRAVIAGLEHPFLLREMVEATGLPRHRVYISLSRLVKKGELTRHPVPINYPANGRPWQKDQQHTRLVYLYSRTDLPE
jgi:hypothetical protein